MRYRKLSATGDYVFGGSQADFYVNTPQAVAQAVQTTLLLWLGEWYLDITAGTPYLQEILGYNSQAEADAAFISQVSNVQGVVNVENWTSSVDAITRNYSVDRAIVNTIYGITQVQIANLGTL